MADEEIVVDAGATGSAPEAAAVTPAPEANVDVGKTPEQGTTPAPEGVKPEGAEVKTDDKGEQKPEEKVGAPDEYKDFSLPEGAKVDSEAMSSFKEFAKGKNLTQDQAQELVDLHGKAIDKVLAGQMERWEQQKDTWKAETLADKDLLGVDGKADEAISIAKNAVVKLGGQELQDTLDLFGMGNHPVIVKAFFKAGKAMSEDGFAFGGGSGDTRTPAQRLFPTMKQ